MKLRLEGTPSELVEKSEDLVRELSGRLAPYAPDVADILEKAFPHEEPEGAMRYPVLEELRQQTAKLYQEHLVGMLEEIGAVLDQGLHKALVLDGETQMDAYEQEELEKAGGPYIGPRGGKWADPEHTIPWKDHEANPEGFTVPKERYEEKEALAKLIDMGERLYEHQAMDPLSQDSTGFSRYDMQVWRGIVSPWKGEPEIRRVRGLLRKYRRQLLGSTKHADADHESLAEWYKLGMADKEEADAVRIAASYHPTYGSLNFKLAGWVARDKFNKFMELASKYHLRNGGNSTVFVARRDFPDFDLKGCLKDLADLGWEVTPPAEGWHTEKPPASAKEAAPVEPEKPLSAEEVRDGILAKPPTVRDKIAVVRDPKDGIIRFYSPFSREFNAVMSNKSGRLSGIMRADPQTWARETHQLELAEEAIGKLQEAHPDWEIVTSGIKEAQLERDTRLADLQKPIPGVAEKLAPSIKLFPYQNECVRFLDQANGNALIGDEMGLGKTAQTLAWAAKNNKRILVVCPKVVRRQWLSEAEKFFPGHFKGAELVSSDIKKKRVPDLKNLSIVTVNYESLDKFYPYIKDAGFDAVVIDESHRMANPKAKVTKELQKLSALVPHHILLSGTAVKNKREDLVTQLEIVAPGQFVETAVTQTRYDPITGSQVPVKTKKHLKNSTIGGLWQDMRGVYLARAKKHVLKDLPEKITVISRIDVPDLPDFDPDWEGDEKFRHMSELRNQVALGKVPTTVEFVHNILENSDDKIIVFSESIECSKQIQAALGDDVAILHYGSGMNDTQREAKKAEFMKQDAQGNFIGTKRVFVTTRPSLAEGANMTAASAVVFNDLPWTAAALRQAEDRTHRPGQKRSVNVYWITADHNQFDSNVQAIIEKKYELAKKQNQGEQLTEQERKWMATPVRFSEIMAGIQGRKAGPQAETGPETEAEKAAEEALTADQDQIEKSMLHATSALDQEEYFHERAAENLGHDDLAGDGGQLGSGGLGAVQVPVQEAHPDFRGGGARAAGENSGRALGGGTAGPVHSLGSEAAHGGGDRSAGGAVDPGAGRATGFPGGSTWRGAESEALDPGEAGAGDTAGSGAEGWQGAPYALADEIELPADLIEALFGDLEQSLEKALGGEKAGHKYIRRVPIIGKDGKRSYRYFYKVTGGMGLGHTGEFQVGARFAVRAEPLDEKDREFPGDAKAGHLEVLEAAGDMVRVQHTETGKSYLMSPKELQVLLHRHHYEAIQATRNALEHDVNAVRVHGSAAQQKRAEAQLEAFEQAFVDVKRFRYKTILSRETPVKPPKGYAETQAAMDGLLLLMQTFDDRKYYESGDDRLLTNVRVPAGMQAAAQETLKRLQALWGDTWAETAKARMKFYRGAEHRFLPGKLEHLAAGSPEGLVRYPVGQPGDYSKVNAYDPREVHNYLAEIHFCLEMDKAKADLRLDSKQELSPEAALLLAEVKLEARKNYFEEGYGSRNGLEALQDYLGQIRTDRGIKAFITLTRGLNDKKIPSHRATVGAIECLGYELNGLLKKAEQRMEAFHAVHQGPVQNTVFRPTPELDAAIERDVKTAQSYLERKETFGTTESKSGVYLQGVERTPEAIKCRFTQIGRTESSVFKLFREKFGVSIFLQDDIFDHFFEAPYVHDEDHNHVDIEKGLHLYSDEEKKAFKKVLKTLKGKDREKAERYLARAQASFGAHAIDPEYASREDKAALAEFQLAADMSYEARVDVLKGLYNALSDIQETLGDFHLSNLPMVVAQRVVGAGANAHYSSEFVGEWLDTERLTSHTPENVTREHFPHIALGLGMEKSLAHELVHALDNRVTVRVTHTTRGVDGAVNQTIDALTGQENAYAKAGALSEPAHQLHSALIKAMGRLDGGGSYASCAAQNLQELATSELLKDAQAKQIYDAAVAGFRAQPGGEVMWKFFQAVREKTAGLERFKKADAEDHKGGTVLSILRELGQVSEDVANRAYWAAGTEILARAVEHHVFRERLKKGQCNPTLTHLNYNYRGEDDRGTYFTEQELDAIQPELEAVLEHLKGNMRKALLEELAADGWQEMPEEDLEKALGAERAGHKYIRRVPKPGGGYTYFYRESAIGRGPQAGETVRVGERDIQVQHVDEARGTVTLHDGGQELEVKHHEWGQLLAQHYGEAYFAHAEKRAQAVVKAIAKHVPTEALHDLKGATDAERLAELETRVPEVYSKLERAFKRQGLSPAQAKTILGEVLARRGWQPEARAVVVGSVVSEGGLRVASCYRQVMSGAENLAGEGLVEAKHAQAAVELLKPEAPDATAKLEAELQKLQGLVQRALAGGDKAKVAGILAHTMALSSEVLHQAQALGVAYPGALEDTLTKGAREELLKVPATAPREEASTEGSQTQVFVAGEGGRPQALQARYRLVEASAIRASHDPLKNFAQNPDYPPGVQERAYHRDLAEQDKVRRNARELNPAFLVNTNPDAINGPPLTTADGLVLGGNSRSMSMQLAYHGHPEKAAELREYLKAHAHEVGLKPGDVEAMKEPILVRVLEGTAERSKAELQLLVRQANESFTQAMDPRTMQVALSRRLDEQTLNSLVTGMEEGETLAAYLGSKRAQGFIQNLRRVGVIDARNVNQFMKQSTGQLNEDGKTLISRILVGRMVDSADLLSDTSGKLLASIAQAVPHMVRAAGYGPGYDLSKSLQTAMHAYNRLQEKVEAGTLKGLDSKISDREIQVIMDNEFADMFGSRHPILDDARAQEILRVLIRKPGPTQMSGVFLEYARLASQNPEGQQLLGVKARSPEEVFRLSVEAATRKGGIAEVEKSLAAEALEKAGGPYIGPKGGKWADPQHTQHWEPEKPQEAPKAEPITQAHPVAQPVQGGPPVKWELAEIHDTREFDWETGKRISGTGNQQECQRCGRMHEVIHRMRNPETGEYKEVGSGCGPKMAGGKEFIDDATVDRAQNADKAEVARKLEERARGWLHAADQKINEYIQEEKIARKPFFVRETPVDPALTRYPLARENWEKHAPQGQLRVFDDFDGTHEVLASKSPFDTPDDLKMAAESRYISDIADQILKEIGVPEKTKWPVKLGPPFRSKDPRDVLYHAVRHTLMDRYYLGVSYGGGGYAWVNQYVQHRMILGKGIKLAEPEVKKALEEPVLVIPFIPRTVKRYPVL